MDHHSVDALLRLAGFEPDTVRTDGAVAMVDARRAERRGAEYTCTVVVPCRNEVDNVAVLVDRLPSLGSHTELVFVDGASTDGTQERIREVIRTHPEREIRLLEQQHAGGGKAAAVYQGFDEATGDVLMILDADMTVAPEDLPRFYFALAEGVGRFANGTRFVYPMEAGATRGLNTLGNRAFCRYLSWLIGARITDTLCGTKALFRSDWQRIAAARPLFGGHDPWGDFDLLLGAAYCGLTIVDVPVRYAARVAGESKMQPFRHGLALARTCLAGTRRLKLGARV
jgi:glycosyltransferase involved in cell wall biosynthesis